MCFCNQKYSTVQVILGSDGILPVDPLKTIQSKLDSNLPIWKKLFTVKTDSQKEISHKNVYIYIFSQYHSFHASTNENLLFTVSEYINNTGVVQAIAHGHIKRI